MSSSVLKMLKPLSQVSKSLNSVVPVFVSSQRKCKLTYCKLATMTKFLYLGASFTEVTPPCFRLCLLMGKFVYNSFIYILAGFACVVMDNDNNSVKNQNKN